MQILQLTVMPGTLAVCRLDAGDPLPGWADNREFCAIVRTRQELSVVCPARQVPLGVRAESGWRALRVAGPVDFALTGVLAALAAPLARAQVSLFAISSYDTDYLLVRDLPHALAALTAAGHRISAGTDRGEIDEPG